MSEISPLDVMGKTFGKKLHGYDPQQVHEFLGEVGNLLEQVIRERGELRQQVARLEQELASFRERETALQQALVAAQRSADETLEKAGAEAEAIVERAREEGQRILEEAQVLAQRVIDETNERVRTLETVIARLRNQRREARAEVLRLVEILQGVVRDDQRQEEREKVTSRVSLLDRNRYSTGEVTR